MSAPTPANNNARLRPDGRPKKVSGAVRKRLAEIETLRDQIRVDLNLAGKDARDRWRRIEERIREARARIRSSEGVRTLGPLVETVKRFRTSLRRKPS